MVNIDKLEQIVDNNILIKSTNEEIDIVCEINELSEHREKIDEYLYYRNEKIIFSIYSTDNDISLLDSKVISKNLESDDKKYLIAIYKNKNRELEFSLQLTESYKNIIYKIENDKVELLNKLRVISCSVDIEGKDLKLELNTKDLNGDDTSISEIMMLNEKYIPYKVQILFKERGRENYIRENVKYNDNTFTYNIELKKLCEGIKENIYYDLYIGIVTYSKEIKLRIVNPYLDCEDILQYNKILLCEDSNKIITPYYTKDFGLSFRVEDLQIKAHIQDVSVKDKKTILSLKLTDKYDNQIDKELISNLYISIQKRRTNLNIIFNEYVEKNDSYYFCIEDKKILEALNLGLWDVYINININNVDNYVRVKNYNEIENKKDVLVYPDIISKEKNKKIKPYYTLDDSFSYEINNELDIKKVDYLKLINNNLEVSFNLSSYEKILSEKVDNVELVFTKENLDEIKFVCKANITNIDDYNNYKIKLKTSNIPNEDIENYIYKYKISVELSFNNQRYVLPINIDYKNIFIENIDYKISDSNYNLKTKILYKIMSKIFPIKKNLVVFQSFGGRSYAGNPKYIYEYANLNNDNDKRKFVWSLRNQFQEIPGNCKKVKIESLKYYYYLSRAEYIVSNLNMQNNIKKRKGTKFIQTWHGTPLKKISFDVNKKSPSYDAKFLKGFAKRVKKWDWLLAPNEYSKNIFRSAFKYNGNIIETGHPLNDILVNNDSEKKQEIKTKLNINGDKKIILYAPTWRDNGRYVLDLDLDSLYEKLGDEYILLIKTHYFVNNSLNIKKFKGFVYDVSKYDDIQELALISDMLITDYSSIMFDYATTKKPMIFYCNDINYYKSNLRGFYFDFENEAPGPIVEDSRKIADIILNINKVNNDYEEKYKNFYNKFVYLEDGNSSKRACNSIFNQGKKKKKIVFLSFNVFGMGGTGRTVINTADSLTEQGYDVELISIFGDEKDKYFEINEKIKVTTLTKKKYKNKYKKLLDSRPSILIDRDDEFYKDFSLLTDIKIIKKLLSLKNAILVSTRPGFNIMICKYFKFRRFKVIGQEHLNFNIHSNKLQSQIKKYYKKLDLLMTLTDADTVGYKNEIENIDKKIVKVPNAVPRLEKSNVEFKNKQIIAAGRLVPQKGFDLLIKSSPKIFKKHPEWVIKIFGKGRDAKNLQSLINKVGVSENVRLMGPSKKIEKEMLESEIYVLSSRYEGFGMVIVEAMQMGIPVVSFDCPEGPREIITNGHNGILVEKENIDELADQIIKLIENPSNREILVDNANKDLNRFHNSNITDIWLDSLMKLT